MSNEEESFIKLKVAPVVQIASNTASLGSATAGADPSSPFVNRSPRSRQPSTLKGKDGKERTFGSALGLLCRKFIDMLFVSLLDLCIQDTRFAVSTNISLLEGV